MTHTDVGLRVLYVLAAFPQLSESYIASEIQWARRYGAKVRVWSSIEPTAPFPTDVPVDRGPLADAIRRFAPDVVHAHWVRTGQEFADIVASAGLRMTVRGHWHHVPSAIGALDQHPAVERIFLFPHLANRLSSILRSVEALPVAFDSHEFASSARKDPRLVVRAGIAKPAKDLETFIRVAARCPRHRFVLAVCLGNADYFQELAELNRTLGEPVELLKNRSHAQMAELQSQAAIQLHTYSSAAPFGMPVSIAESMATGGYIVCRRLPGASEYVGNAGTLYADDDEAVGLIRETGSWSPGDWARVQSTSSTRAAENFADHRVLPALWAAWTQAAQVRRAPGAAT
jgi:glycosyltransferase involved in cell wall biosynthesis